MCEGMAGVREGIFELDELVVVTCVAGVGHDLGTECPPVPSVAFHYLG